MSLLSIGDLGVHLGGRAVLKDISFEIAPGELVGLIGPNGAGKSTLLRAVLGLIEARGRVRLGDRDTASLSRRDIARRIAYVAQGHEIAWDVSVESIVALGRAVHRRTFSGLGTADRAAVEAAMRQMQVDGFRSRRATALSGGETARVLIARALAQETPLLLADEPVAALDPAHQIGVMQHFRRLADEGRAIVSSLHDLGLAARWCTRLILLDRGRLAADGPPEAVLTPENLRRIYRIEAYLGTADGGMLVAPLNTIAAQSE